jgi:uncharacterized protein (UPF0332 family)
VKSEVLALARHRLDRARTTFAERRQLLESDRAAGAVNRFYYAAFHAARAVLALQQRDSARHAGIIALFQAHVVKTGDVDAETARALPRAFEKRLKSDYGDFATVSPEEATAVGDQVQAFIGACAGLVDRSVADGQFRSCALPCSAS